VFEKADHGRGVIKEQNVSSDVLTVLLLWGRTIKAKINRGRKVPYYRRSYRVWKGIKKLR
jgi:hypothetical protein